MAFDEGSLFGDYDVATAPDDPFSIPDGTYKGVITDFKRVEGVRAADGVAWAMISVGLKTDSGLSTDYRLYLPGAGDSEAQVIRKRSSMKAFLTGLEVPPHKMNTVRRDDLIGLNVVFSVTSGKSARGSVFRNFTFQLAKGAPVTSNGSSSSNPGTGLDEFVRAAGKDTASDDFGL